MNLSNPNINPSEVKIKKLKILPLAKNPKKSFSQINIFSNNKTPIFKNKIPFLLKSTSNNSSTNLSTVPFKKKLFTLFKGNNTRKNLINKSRLLFDELSEKKTKKEKINKSNAEIRKKFYIRCREGLKYKSESEDVLNILNDSPSSQYFLSMNNTFYKNKNKENIKNFFAKLKKHKTKLIMPKINNITNITPKNEENNNNKYCLKKRKFKPKFRNISVKNYELMKQIFKKHIKKNSKIFSRSLYNIDNEIFSYEPIYKKESESNIKANIFYNKNNLERIIRVEKINKKGFDEDELVDDVYNIRKYNNNPEFLLKKLKQTYVPRIIKLNNFTRSTLIKYNNLHRSNFGYPN